MLNNFKKAAAAAAVIAFSFSGQAVFAQNSTQLPQQQQQQVQTDYSDKEIKQFVDANTRLMDVQAESEKVMMTILQEEKLEVNKFNELAQAHQQQQLQEAEATPEEMAAFNKAAQRMIEMQPEVQQKVEKAIVKDGLTMEKYEQMLLAYQQSPAVQAKVNQMMQQGQ
ncbi:DUF4168 domain-containing protein [Pontibacter harenae]|uniref:DUF4168 domain-containing protein n=1 Tax=Pontibacter harenae TaxID=2894083 RepID=UPI001E2B4E42|nr:DUF4168 domain-containing protein [Pontibacter harenae]MCC9165228.1 DUF4168 domain-containing protein [Pontibacter harenae]